MKRGEEHIDPRVLVIDHHFGQYERLAPVAAYHKYVLKKCVRIADLRGGMKILDFGCGRQMLKRMLPPGIDYVGYDLAPSLSDVDDFRAQRYDVVFAIQVLQYPDRVGVAELVEDFAVVTTRVIVMLPVTNFLKTRVLDPIFGLRKDAKMTFRSTPDEVLSAFEKKFAKTCRSLLIGMGEITRWERL